MGYTDHTGLSPQDCITNDNNSRNLTGWLVNEMTAQSNRWPSKPGIGTVVGFSNGFLSSAAFQITKAALDKLAYGQDITEEGKTWIKRELAAGGGLRVIGYIWWAEMVKDGARWDFKDQIRVNPPDGPGESIMLCDSATDCDWYEFSMPEIFSMHMLVAQLDLPSLKSAPVLYMLNRLILKMIQQRMIGNHLGAQLGWI